MKALFLSGVSTANNYDNTIRLRERLVHDYLTHYINRDYMKAADYDAIEHNIAYAADLCVISIFNSLINGIIAYVNSTSKNDCIQNDNIDNINVPLNLDNSTIGYSIYDTLVVRGSILNDDIDIIYPSNNGVDVPNVEVLDNAIYSFIEEIPKMLSMERYKYLKSLFLNIANELLSLKSLGIFNAFVNYNIDLMNGDNKNIIIGAVEDGDLVPLDGSEEFVFHYVKPDRYYCGHRDEVFNDLAFELNIEKYMLSSDAIKVLEGVYEDINK